jgi:O-antigen/teichoic acid export membrane protein
MLLGYSFQLLIFGLSFVSSIIIARVLGPEGRGEYALLMTLHGTLLVCSIFGFDTVLRKAGKGSPRAQQGKLLGSTMVASLVLFAFLVPLFLYIGQRMDLGPGMWPYVLLALLSVPIAQFFALMLALVAGHERVWAYNLFSMGQRTLVLLIIFLLAVLGALTSKSTLATNVLAGIPFLFLLVFYLKRVFRIKFSFDLSLLKEKWRFAGGAYVATLAMALVLKVDQLILGAYGGMIELGYYAVAVTLVDALMLGPSLVATFILPRLVGLLPSERIAFFKKLWLFLVVVMLGIAVVGFVLSPWVIPLLFGQTYAPTVTLFRILLGAVVFLGLFTITQQALAVYVEDWRFAYGPLLALAVNIILNFLWIPTYGAVGAAWASVVAYAIACGVVVVQFFWLGRLRTR